MIITFCNYYADNYMMVLWTLEIGMIAGSKVHGANVGPIWGREDPDGPHVGPMNFAIWDGFYSVDKDKVKSIRIWK